MIFAIHTPRDISKLSHLCITTSKYHSWYLCQISLQIMLLPTLIIRVINICFAICLITSVITDRTERHEVLLPINHNYNKICDILGILKLKHKKIPRVFFLLAEKKCHLSARLQWCVLSNHLGMTRTVLLHCPIKVMLHETIRNDDF